MTAILYEKEVKREEKDRKDANKIQCESETFPVKVKKIPTAPKRSQKTTEISKEGKKPKKISRELKKLNKKAKYNAKYFEELKSKAQVDSYFYYNKFIPY
jgi:ribosomal protein L22